MNNRCHTGKRPVLSLCKSSVLHAAVMARGIVGRIDFEEDFKAPIGALIQRNVRKFEKEGD